MSSEKELNRAKWQHNRRHKQSNKHNKIQAEKQQSLKNSGSSIVGSTYQSTQAPGLQQTMQQIHTNTNPSDYLDNFDLDFEELGGEQEGVIFNSSGFDFEKLLQQAQNDSLVDRRHWSLSREFEDRQAFLEQTSEFMQVDLLGLGQALEDLPITQLFGISASFFNKDTQALTLNVNAEDEQSSSKQSSQIKEEEQFDEFLDSATSDLNQDSQLNSSNQHQTWSDRTLQLEPQTDNQQLKQEEAELDELLFGGGDQSFERNKNINNNTKFQRVKKNNINSQKLQQLGRTSVESQGTKDDQDGLDEVDQLLQL